jgi:hypothetical protein
LSRLSIGSAMLDGCETGAPPGRRRARRRVVADEVGMLLFETLESPFMRASNSASAISRIVQGVSSALRGSESGGEARRSVRRESWTSSRTGKVRAARFYRARGRGRSRAGAEGSRASVGGTREATLRPLDEVHRLCCGRSRWIRPAPSIPRSSPFSRSSSRATHHLAINASAAGRPARAGESPAASSFPRGDRRRRLAERFLLAVKSSRSSTIWNAMPMLRP